MLSLIRWSCSSPSRMPSTHPSTWGPLINVSTIATCHIGDSKPGTPWLAIMYIQSSLMKASVWVLSPSNSSGGMPTGFRSPAGCIGMR